MGVEKGVNSSGATRPPGEPAVIRRLPAGVEYTFIKLITHDGPPALTTVTWVPADVDASPWGWFQTKTFSWIDHELQKHEHTPSAGTEERRETKAVRHEFVQQFLGMIGLEAGTTKKWISIRLVNPVGLDPQYQPSGPLRLSCRIEVWSHTPAGARLLAEEVLVAEPPPWGEPQISWFDPDKHDQTSCALFREHFSDLMKLRPGRHWRTERAPSGWPLITQHVIPGLYDYLRPYYETRQYRHGRTDYSSGDYPGQLRRDITAMLQVELPYLAGEITVERVTAAIQRYLDGAPTDRPMGRELFVVPLPKVDNKTT